MTRLAGAAPAGTEPTPVPAGARRRRRSLVAVAVAAGVLLVAGGFAAGAEINRGSSGSSAAAKPPAIRTATASGSWGMPVCQVFAYPGRPAVVVVNVDSPGEAGTYSVDLVTSDKTVPLGTIQVTDGKGSLGAVADVDLANARSVRVIENDGSVLYEAPFRNTA